MVNPRYIRYSYFLIFWTFLVVLAGGIVRTTQSGMGCPDWPTCFGSWIPPISADDLPPDFEKYLDKQDIDHTFNVYHTWVEYINRCLGALLGILILIHTIWTFRIQKTNFQAKMWALLLLFTVGFTGWLGKVVVDGNLEVAKVTLHMVTALLLLIIPLFGLRSLGYMRSDISPTISKHWYSGIILVAFIQLLLGTQVRENIDVVSKSLSYESRHLWIEQLGSYFEVHRSFSWLVVFIVLYGFYGLKHSLIGRRYGSIFLMLVMSSILVGVSFVWFDMPAFLQPIHLVLGFMLVFYGFYFRVLCLKAIE